MTATPPCLGELDGVAGEIEQHLAQARGVAHEFARAAARRRSDAISMPLACARGAKQFDGFLDQRNERERPRLQIELAGLDLGEIENLLDQRQQRFARGLRRLGVSELLGRERRVEQQIGHAENAVERRADFVADRGEEARLGAVGGFRLVARLLERAQPRRRQLPIVVGQFLDACFQPAHFVAMARWRISMKAMTAQAAANSAPTPVP